jgi:hypothetical protein
VEKPIWTGKKRGVVRGMNVRGMKKNRHSQKIGNFL